jgi:hypothetical protein
MAWGEAEEFKCPPVPNTEVSWRGLQDELDRR